MNMLLGYAKLARSTFYYHTKKKVDKYESVKEEIEKIFIENEKRYGYRRIMLALQAEGYVINHKTVLKLMNEMNIHGKQRMSRYKSYKGEVGIVAPNILNREFTALNPYEKLATDVTEFAVCGEKVYFSPVMDLYNREILSYSISKSPNFAQTREMLDGLFKVLPRSATPLLHSDQGWQYQMKEYQRRLREHNITQSMSRKGNCLDNSCMENFFGRLKVEMFIGESFESADDFIDKLHKYIYYYNNKRISLKLKGMSPVQYRTHSRLTV